MNGEENSQLNKESKFRFLNPEEKRKLKVINEEILGNSKSINFDANVDLAIQFAPRSYDTQRYNIKKIVDERLNKTLVFNSSVVREKLEREKSEVSEDLEKLDEYYDDFENDSEDDFYELEEKSPRILFTSVVKNDVDGEPILENEEIVNERLEEQTAIIQRELQRILRNSLEQELKEEIVLENSTNEAQVEEKKVHLNKSEEKEIVYDNPNPKFVEEISENERQYLRNIQSQEEKKLQLAEEKKKHARELFRYEEEHKEDYNEAKTKASRLLFYMIIIVLLTLIVFVFTRLATMGKEQNASKGLDVISPITAEKWDDLGWEIQIVSNNTKTTIVEVTNDNFIFGESSNEIEYFNDYVFGNFKNAKPSRENNKLIVVFGKDDNKHFGSLKYLKDIDYFNSIEVNIIEDGIPSGYKAVGYYTSENLNNKLYAKLTDDEIISFVNEELSKSIHGIESIETIDENSEILTLVKFDNKAKIYHVAYLTKL